MRIILIYDLPMTDEEERKIYSHFHKNLIYLGLHMMQYSVYSKVIINETAYSQLKSKLNKIIPKKGNVMIFKITEKQYQDIIYLEGKQNKHDIIVGGNELVIFGGDEDLFRDN